MLFFFKFRQEFYSGWSWYSELYADSEAFGVILCLLQDDTIEWCDLKVVCLHSVCVLVEVAVWVVDSTAWIPRSCKSYRERKHLKVER